MFNPPRPTITDEMISEAATKYIHANPELLEAAANDDDWETAANDMAECYKDDGYEMAVELDNKCLWQIDAAIVAVLDDFRSYVDDELEKAVKAWVAEHNIQPPLKKGTRVEFYHGRLKTGVITGVYKHKAGCYEIKMDDEPHENMRAIVKYELAKPA